MSGHRQYRFLVAQAQTRVTLSFVSQAELASRMGTLAPAGVMTKKGSVPFFFPICHRFVIYKGRVPFFSMARSVWIMNWAVWVAMLIKAAFFCGSSG